MATTAPTAAPDRVCRAPELLLVVADASAAPVPVDPAPEVAAPAAPPVPVAVDPAVALALALLVPLVFPTRPTPYALVDAPSSAHVRPPKTCAMNVSSCHVELRWPREV